MSFQHPVLIAGAGPVGLSLALALARRGIAVEVFEQDAELNREIRASTFHPRTLEMFAEWDVLDDILARGHAVGQLQYWERSPRQVVANFDYRAIAADTPYPYRLQCPQHVATRVLKPAVGAAGGIVHMAHRLLDFDDRGTHITARFQTPAGAVTHAGACPPCRSRMRVSRLSPGMSNVGSPVSNPYWSKVIQATSA